MALCYNCGKSIGAYDQTCLFCGIKQPISQKSAKAHPQYSQQPPKSSSGYPGSQHNPWPANSAYGQNPYSQQTPYPQSGYGQPYGNYNQPYDRSPLSKTALLLLCWYLGVIGAHRFYAGKIITAILMLITAGGLGIWTIIDFIRICFNSFSDSQGRQITGPCRVLLVLFLILFPLLLGICLSIFSFVFSL
jgi:TM2 domain-containing membrane protein YozV